MTTGKGGQQQNNILGWLPIDLAPKDGSVVLVNNTRIQDAPWVAAKYLSGEEWSGCIYVDELLCDHNPLGPCPTHYFPVPSVPKAEKRS